MAETRINLKHLLGNLRDSYPFSIEEAILTELIANSLDSHATSINISILPGETALRVVDNGEGMSRSDFRQYHDIASSHKIRGQGIGFAGVGAKLALLLCRHVDTETRQRKTHLQSRWQLLKEDRARWQSLPPEHHVTNGTGTAVTLYFRKQPISLLDAQRIHDTIQRHFQPLLDSYFHQMLRTVYPSRVSMTLNGQLVRMAGFDHATAAETFAIRLSPRNKPVGIGFLSLNNEPLPEELQGLGVSTYGKVIKRGWDWLALAPRRPDHITGLVEVPGLASILTLNKADFLKTPSTLKKYYRYRSAIQRVVQPILENFGEVLERKPVSDIAAPIERELESVLARILPEFPELEPLVGISSRGGISVPVHVAPRPAAASPASEAARPDGGAPVVGAPGADRDRKASDKTLRRGLQVGFEDDPQRSDLGWMSGNTIWINRSHPAFLRNQKSSSHSFHVALTVALVLSRQLLDERSPQQFVSEFLSLWGRATGRKVLSVYEQPSLPDHVQ
ncbi:MAG: ATP-binding protein [Acidobacteria bacterium]|nr:ATP-binding protein [Acidobacteriota bacterium]